MRRLLRNKKALSTVVASLILLVVSVLLAGVASYFALNVAGSRVQQEKLYLSNVAVWYKNSTTSLGSLLVTNTGATDIVLSKVTIKGQESPWNGTQTYVLFTKIKGILAANLEYISNFNKTGTNQLTLDAIDYDFDVVSENLILQSGWTMLFFIVNPQNLIVYDVARAPCYDLYRSGTLRYRNNSKSRLARLNNLTKKEDTMSPLFFPFLFFIIFVFRKNTLI